MLFDLRGRGRRRAVQTIYLGLALIMGGGLVLFGVGGNTSGGLFDAFSSGKSGSNSTFTKQIKSTQKRIDAHPTVAAGYAKLASLHLAEGGSQGGFDGNANGVREFRLAAASWNRYLTLKPEQIDLSVARQMINVYGQTGLNLPDKAVGVMDVIVEQTTPPQADLYKQYALLAFAAGQTRKGDLAIGKAVSLTPPAQRKATRTALESLKAQAAAAAAQQTSGAAAAPVPDTTATTAPATTTTTSTPKSKTPAKGK